MTDKGFTGALGGRIALGAFLIGLLFLSYRVLHLFLVPVAWGLILVYVTWPLHRRLRARLSPYPGLSAFVMSLLLTLVFVLPVLWVIFMLRAEVPALYARLVVLLSQGPDILPPGLARLPWIGAELERLLAMAAEDPSALRHQVLLSLKPLAEDSLQLAGDLGATAFKFGFAVLSAFFLYRDGDQLLDQTRRLLLGLLGGRSESYLKAIGDTTRGVLYGLVLTALVQGALAGAGYWAAGIETPILFGVLTTFLALIPFGTPLVIGLVCLWLFLTGEVWPAAGLAAWGALVVGQIDNLFRPLVISSAARIPYILVLFAVLGGLTAFGLVGLFVGPIVIAILLAVWREWIAEQGSRA
ncbi:AI-2E family transporter [Thiocystis violacea]|uniref:AI-2E family transporter n=1 Tax=Thiocystis violacea TaxID=13725 RepID=UPI0019072E51|nr:AI-2E family transporter [Thiocystis violacea]MBK1717095.1 AI-2E family transporter [Thiocystis violacea]